MKSFFYKLVLTWFVCLVLTIMIEVATILFFFMLQSFFTFLAVLNNYSSLQVLL